MSDTLWRNLVLLKRVKSACGVGMWFESSHALLYSNSLLYFPLPSWFLVTCSNWGQGCRSLACFFFFPGTVWRLHSHYAWCFFLYFYFCSGIFKEKRRRKIWLVNAPNLTIRVSSVLMSLIKAVDCLCPAKEAKDKCQKDYFKFGKVDIGRNKHEMICTKTTISDASWVDVQYWRSSERRTSCHGGTWIYPLKW